MSAVHALLPAAILGVGGCLILLLDAFIRKISSRWLSVLGLLVLFSGGAACASLWGKKAAVFGGLLVWDDFGLLFGFLFLVAAAFAVLLALAYNLSMRIPSGEFLGLLMFASSGLLVMVSSRNLVVIFLGLEVVSIASYALAGLNRSDERSSEAALKYFLLGSFAGAVLVFGLALLFGSAGSLEIEEILAFFQGPHASSALTWTGLALVLIGFFFKIAVVPFHMWAPDVYLGAPTPVTAFFSVAPKAAGFAVLFRILAPALAGGPGSDSGDLRTVISVLAVATMLLGSLAGLRQTNVKRLLAYSSIANAGYMLLAVLAKDGAGLIFFLASYLFMSFGAFGSLAALIGKGRETHELDEMAGLGIKSPWIGSLFAVFLISLAGFPPTAGFLAKFYVFSAAVRQGFTALVLVAVAASLVSAFYYLRVVVTLFMREPAEGMEIDFENPALFLVLFLCLYGVFQLGILPGNVLVFIRQAVAGLF
jgi:NADH-quinone oxidoreductase subunit N